MPVKSKWERGNGLTFFEDGVGRNTTGDIFNIDTDKVQVGNSLNDIDFKVFAGAASLFFLVDCGNERVDFGQDDYGIDVRFFGKTSGDLILMDASQDSLIFTDIDLQLKDSAKMVLGTGAGIPGDFQVYFDGTRLLVEPQTDDLVIRFGKVAATQLSPDVELYGNAANGADKLWWDASESALKQGGAAEIELGRMKYAVVTAKASNYVVTAADSGTLFHTTGAGSTVAFTLPTPAEGLSFRFFNAVDQGMKIAGDAANKMIVYNDLDADDIRFYTGSQKTGAYVEVVGLSASKWMVMPLTARTQQTMTVTT